MTESYRSVLIRLSPIVGFLLLPYIFAATPQNAVGAEARRQAADSAEVAGIVSSFHEALEGQDSTVALGLLAEDALIAESGGLETKSEYRSHHLPGDMAFASAVSRTTSLTRLQLSGNTAWVVSTSETVGTYRDNAIDSVGVELMVLMRGSEGWRIAAIHWSSRRAR